LTNKVKVFYKDFGKALLSGAAFILLLKVLLRMYWFIVLNPSLDVPAQRNLAERVGYLIAGWLPILGPVAAQAGYCFGQRWWGDGIGYLSIALLPIVAFRSFYRYALALKRHHRKTMTLIALALAAAMIGCGSHQAAQAPVPPPGPPDLSGNWSAQRIGDTTPHKCNKCSNRRGRANESADGYLAFCLPYSCSTAFLDSWAAARLSASTQSALRKSRVLDSKLTVLLF